jgi:hypothetical protein
LGTAGPVRRLGDDDRVVAGPIDRRLIVTSYRCSKGSFWQNDQYRSWTPLGMTGASG